MLVACSTIENTFDISVDGRACASWESTDDIVDYVMSELYPE